VFVAPKLSKDGASPDQKEESQKSKEQLGLFDLKKNK